MTDLLLVCLGSTGGLRAAEDELAGALTRAGATLTRVTAVPPREVRTFMATDLQWARAARRAAVDALAVDAPRAVVYSTTTAALLWPRRGAIRFDALAADTRPGRHGLWQRPLEERRLAAAPLLVPQADGAFGARPAPHPDRVVVVPVPVTASGPLDGKRDIAAVTYGANWRKKGLDRVLAAWREATAAGAVPAPGAQAPPVAADVGPGADGPAGPAADAAPGAPAGHLVVTGVEPALVAEAWAASGGAGALPASVRAAGVLAPAEYRALLRRACVFVTAPRREDYGIAQLEALADGCALVTTAAPGPYAALPLARALDPRLVVEDGDDTAGLGRALRTALDATARDRAPTGPQELGPDRRSAALAPFTREAVDRVVAEVLLPRLLP